MRHNAARWDLSVLPLPLGRPLPVAALTLRTRWRSRTIQAFIERGGAGGGGRDMSRAPLRNGRCGIVSNGTCTGDTRRLLQPVIRLTSPPFERAFPSGANCIAVRKSSMP